MINSSHVISPDFSADIISLTISSSVCFGNKKGNIVLLDAVVVCIFHPYFIGKNNTFSKKTSLKFMFFLFSLAIQIR